MAKNSEYRLPNWWQIILVVSVGFGAILLWTSPELKDWEVGISAILTPEEWVKVFGIMLIAVPVTHWITYFAIRGVDRLFDIEHESKQPDLWPPTLVGVLESVLYPAAFATDNAEFIGVWLLMKVAGQWVRWGAEFPPVGDDDDGEENGDSKYEMKVLEAKKGRRRFQKFLIGNAIRIMLGAATYFVLRAAVLPVTTLEPICCIEQLCCQP